VKKLRPIVIDPEFRALVPPMDAESFAQLEANIREHGLKDKLTLWKSEDGTYTLIDGHHRFEILKRFAATCRTNPDVPYFGEIKSFDEVRANGSDAIYSITDTGTVPDREAVKLWILEHQVGRRNLTDDQRAVIWNEIRERRAAIARTEQLQQARDSKAGVLTVEDETTPTEAKQRTRAAVAKEANLPERKLRAAQEIKAADPELSERAANSLFACFSVSLPARTCGGSKQMEDADTKAEFGGESGIGHRGEADSDEQNRVNELNEPVSTKSDFIAKCESIKRETISNHIADQLIDAETETKGLTKELKPESKPESPEPEIKREESHYNDIRGMKALKISKEDKKLFREIKENILVDTGETIIKEDSAEEDESWRETFFNKRNGEKTDSTL
jgi:hypothetical protein